MVAHTGFLTLARRVQPDAGGRPGMASADVPDEVVDAPHPPGPEVA
jgi:hypothetical protein